MGPIVFSVTIALGIAQLIKFIGLLRNENLYSLNVQNRCIFLIKYSTTICKLVDLIPAPHQSDCRIPNWVSAKTVLSSSTNHGQTTARFRVIISVTIRTT